MKKLLIILLVLLPMLASANVVNIDGLWYNLVSDTKTAVFTVNPNDIMRGDYSGEVTIPDKVYYGTEYSVVAIGDFAFINCKELCNLRSLDLHQHPQ